MRDDGIPFDWPECLAVAAWTAWAGVEVLLWL